MDVFLKILLVILLFFTPFAFAGTEPWSFLVMQGGVAACWILLLFSRRHLLFSSLLKPVYYLFGFLLLLCVIQFCFPKNLLMAIPWYPITLMPLYTWEHAALFLTYAGVFSLIPQLYVSQDDTKRLLFWVLISASAVALCAFSLPQGDYIFQLVGRRGGVGPFLNRNHAAIFFMMGALATLGLFFTQGLKAARSTFRGQRRAFYWQQGCLFAVFLGLCFACIMTRSRGGMLSLLCALFCYAFLYAYAIPLKLKKRLKNVFMTLVVLVLCMGWITTHIKEINVFAQRDPYATEETRRMLYRTSWKVLKDYPAWGIGVGAMPVVITSYVEWPVDSYIERLHNDWLEILLGVGYVGAGFILFGLGWFVWLVLRRLKQLETRKQLLFAAVLSALAGMCVGSFVDFHFFIPANAFLFFVLLGVLGAPTYAKGHIYTLSLSLPVKVFGVALVVLALYVPLQKAIAWRGFVFGKGLKRDAQLALYEKSLRHYPSPHYAIRLGNAYYNASLRAQTPEERQALRAKAFHTARIYLQRYPKDKELSFLYMRSRP